MYGALCAVGFGHDAWARQVSEHACVLHTQCQSFDRVADIRRCELTMRLWDRWKESGGKEEGAEEKGRMEGRGEEGREAERRKGRERQEKDARVGEGGRREKRGVG